MTDVLLKKGNLSRSSGAKDRLKIEVTGVLHMGFPSETQVNEERRARRESSAVTEALGRTRSPRFPTAPAAHQVGDEEAISMLPVRMDQYQAQNGTKQKRGWGRKPQEVHVSACANLMGGKQKTE